MVDILDDFVGVVMCSDARTGGIELVFGNDEGTCTWSNSSSSESSIRHQHRHRHWGLLLLHPASCLRTCPVGRGSYFKYAVGTCTYLYMYSFMQQRCGVVCKVRHWSKTMHRRALLAVPRRRAPSSFHNLQQATPSVALAHEACVSTQSRQHDIDQGQMRHSALGTAHLSH